MFTSLSRTVCIIVICLGSVCRAEKSIARVWNEEILSAIRVDTPNPPVHARNLFHLAVCMYDAWVAYDSVAVGYIRHERVRAPGDIEKDRREAISYAAYRMLRCRYATSVSAPATLKALNNRMIALGYNPWVTTVVGDTPAALGNRIAATIIAWGNQDGSNQLRGYSDPKYANSQPAMMVLQNGLIQGGGVPAGTNPHRWQPLVFDVALTQNGLAAEKSQKYVGVTWLNTLPFALERTDPAKPWIDTGPPALLGSPDDRACKDCVMDIIRCSSRLNSSEVIDISPGAIGNNPVGEDTGKGYPVNPITGKPYATNLVARGDFVRILAEFWADGPKSETPPGHWYVIANQVADSGSFAKRLGGTGPVLNDLEWDIKTYFALSGAAHDAACAAWALKRYYEGVRPITLIRYMAMKGQSSDPAGPSYSPGGLPLEPGVVEVITGATVAPGQRHHGVGNIGEIAVYSWPGEPADPKTQTSPVKWMKAKDWVPYQRKTFNNPAFPGYVSGHSTFSGAAAAVLEAATGSPYFPGGLSTFSVPANSYLVFERGPSKPVQLQWATYRDAADQAGQSRRWGGIHVSEDDFKGRIIGAECGRRAWQLARKYFDGSALKVVSPPTFALAENQEPQLDWKCNRGMFYTLQSSKDQINWVTDFISKSTDTIGSARVDIKDRPRFFRVIQQLSPKSGGEEMAASVALEIPNYQK